jgi:GNAT superfamily N-acetyltransferase
MLEMMYSHTTLQRQMSTEGHEFVLAHVGPECVGFAGYSADSATTFKLHKLYVLSTMHGMGVGKKLLEEVCKRAKTSGASDIILQVNKNNKARDFYMANGFTIDRELVLDIGHGFVMDDFIMQRRF